MLGTTNQLPTLGYMHKVVCDCLGLWSCDIEDVTFNVAATENERRTALSQAFEEIKKADGGYGSHNELLAVIAQFTPTDTQEVKKSKTIQAYVNHISKADFESVHEYIEFSQYIETLLKERYAEWGISELAVSFYRSALDHYREFVREHSCNTESQANNLHFFLSQYLGALSRALAHELLPDDAWPVSEPNEVWPLKEFADRACLIAGISLHKLHQYHEFQQEGPLKKEAWTRDFTGKQVNTRSKQVIARLRKLSRMKWETFYPTLQPLTYHMPKAASEKVFAIHAFAAMVAHNLNVNAADLSPLRPPAQNHLMPDKIRRSHSIPSSDLVDLAINGYTVGDESVAQQAPYRYRTLLDSIRRLPGSLNLDADVPGSAELAYGNKYRRFTEGGWHLTLKNAPNWIMEWGQAREAMYARDSLQALTHFKSALEKAKYAAGPLFFPFYIQLCAFCKHQYRLLSERNETELFDRLYEGVGSTAAKYAALMGYTPQYVRNPKTLIPYTTLPLKTQWIIREIDACAMALRN